MDKPASTILIVDDDERETRLLEAQLKAEGYATMSALSGEDALEQMRQYLPDLILLDILMPNMSGYDVAQRLKSDVHTPAISR